MQPLRVVISSVTILVGHPAGNPNSHQAALAYFEAGQLAACCVPWMPSSFTLSVLEHIGPWKPLTRMLCKRHFPPLEDAPKIQGRIGEWRRLLTRAWCGGDERLSYEANDWLMRTMSRECCHPEITAIHAYEDCSLWQFAQAKRLGKACIYDMPIGYYSAWENVEVELVRKYGDWVPASGLPSSHYVRPGQKRQEMELADLVLVPSDFVASTVAQFHPRKSMALAPYGVDAVSWFRPTERAAQDTITFLFAGQCSLRKGVPLLLEAWRSAGLKNARLQLVGSWQLAEAMQRSLPPQAEWVMPVSRDRLRDYYNHADVFVLPSYFEGRALVVGEAMASGLPVISTPASGAGDLIDDSCGRLIPTGSVDALVSSFRWFDNNRDQLPKMSRAARAQAERCTWENYRRCVFQAVAPYL
jgi:glycosyltransferase involved in cell wall biosynthesis